MTSSLDGLREAHRRTVRAMVPAVCPSDVVTLDLVDDVSDLVDTTVAAFSPLVRRAFTVALVVIEAAGLRHGAPFSRLTLHKATEVVSRLSNGSAASRRLVRSVRDLIVVAYFDQPIVKERLGYRPGDWTEVTATRWRTEWGAEAEGHRELLRTRLPRPGAGR